MAAPRSRTAQAATLPNYAPFVAVLAVIVGIGAALLRLPGPLLMLLGLAVAGLISQPPQLTGKKDAAGYPTVGNPGEGKRLTSHRMWKDLRCRLVMPNADWMFSSTRDLKQVRERAEQIASRVPVLKQVTPVAVGVGYVLWLIIPTAFVTIAAVGAACAVYTLPVDALAMWFGGNENLAETAGWLMWPNALAAYLLIQQTFAVRRRYAAPQDPMPAVSPTGLAKALARKNMPTLVPIIVAVAAFALAAAGVTVALHGFGIAWLIYPWPVTAAGVGFIAASFALRALSLPDALDEWRNTVDARAAWDSRWETMKLDPAPYLIRHTRHLVSDDALPVVLDTFEAPAAVGASNIIARGKKGEVTQALGGGTFVQVLNEPDRDSQGQPIPSSRAPLAFSVLSWPADVQFNVLDPDLDQELFSVLLRGIAASAVQGGAEQLMLDEVSLISTGESASASADDFDEGSGDEPGTAWAVTWAAPAGASLGDLGTVADAISARFGVEAIADPGQAVVFIGNLTDGTTDFVDDSIATRLVELDRETQWQRRFEESGKTGDGARAYIQHSVYTEHKTAGGQTLFVQPFMTGRGLDPLEFAMNAQREAKLATALDSPPWLSIQSWPDPNGRPGSRHPGAFRVIWSQQPITSNPADLRQIPRQFGGNKANEWILQHMLDVAFDAVRLARPEVIRATPLTAVSSPKSIWDVHIRLYGATTLADVKKNIAKIRNAMGATAWIRVTGAEDGCRIIAGESPTSGDVDFPSAREEDLCTALNWEQAFTDAKILGPNGESPQLVSADAMPANPKVKSIVFRMPPGISREMIRSAKKTLMPATGNVYLEDEAGPTPDTVKLITCADQPVPFPAPFDWDAVERSQRIPFASGVTGEPIEFDVKDSPHAIILGGTGSGKSALLQNLIAGALIRQADVYVADPTKAAADFQFMGDYIKAMPVTDLEASAMMDHIYKNVVMPRKELNAEYQVASYTDLPADVRPPHVYVFIDEFTSLMFTDKIARLPNDANEEEVLAHQEAELSNAARRNIGAMAGRIVREARSAGVTLVLAAQELKSDTLASIPGGGSIKNNSSSILLGKTTFGSRQSALKDPLSAPELGDDVPKGRGLFESPSRSAQVIQSWYDAPAHEQSLLRHIGEVRSVLGEDEKVELASQVKKVEAGPVFGRIIDVDEPAEIEEASDDVVEDLGEVSFDFGDIFGGADAADDAAEEPEPEPEPVGEDEEDDDAARAFDVELPGPEPEPAPLSALPETDQFVVGEVIDEAPAALPEPSPVPEPLPAPLPVSAPEPVPAAVEAPAPTFPVVEVPEFDWDDEFTTGRKPIEDGF